MGREVRRVPANWEHPQVEIKGCVRAQPMHDQHFDDCFAEWLADFDRIRRGDLNDLERECYPRGLADWLQDDGIPPDPAYYRPWRNSESSWFQVWETVSEGTPVTPPFATQDELIDYLAANGDFWAQKRGTPPPSHQQAESFVRSGWVPSFVMMTGQTGTQLADSYQVGDLGTIAGTAGG